MRTQLSAPSTRLQALDSSNLMNPVTLSAAAAQSKDPMSAKCSDLHVKALFSTAAALLVVLFVAIATATAQDQPVALKGAKLLTITHGTIENGTVIMQGGKITAVGADVSIPPNAQVIDATGMTIYP